MLFCFPSRYSPPTANRRSVARDENGHASLGANEPSKISFEVAWPTHQDLRLESLASTVAQPDPTEGCTVVLHLNKERQIQTVGRLADDYVVHVLAAEHQVLGPC